MGAACEGGPVGGKPSKADLERRAVQELYRTQDVGHACTGELAHLHDLCERVYAQKQDVYAAREAGSE